MNSWTHRPYEERNLLNPAFCSVLLWHAARGAASKASSPRNSLSLIEAFLILPLVLHEKTRISIPKVITTSMPIWIDSEPLIVASFPSRCRSLVPHTKEAISFGGQKNLFSIENNEIIIIEALKSNINKFLRETSDEVRECAKKAEFIGRWFAHTGNPETIFTLLGVRP
ncbi:three component ABC system middle component [Ruficoccus sp. ZRK36]|uniref:three component ABC system middle component n=1 Tax=Ruficoccus sp. ZRK36 TaxID=2866311 RepID=UPI001C732AD2|nr:three component ABC system middle component [Ruficoccus sp. ZRK36]QYY34570.1 hypothetical protein K0V07_09670 [Ruficoccus sp. ZRK36]